MVFVGWRLVVEINVVDLGDEVVKGMWCNIDLFVIIGIVSSVDVEVS